MSKRELILGRVLVLVVAIVALAALSGCSSGPRWTHENDHSYKKMTYWGEYGTTNGRE